MTRITLGYRDYTDLRMTVMVRDAWKCRVCGAREHLMVHHLVYKSQGGDDASPNLLTVCFACHDAIHAHTLQVLHADSPEFNADAKNIQFHFNGYRPGSRA